VAKLEHPNIVTIHEVGEYEGRPYFAMQYVAGESLHHYCHKETLSINKTVDLSLQICEGLEKAHQAGITHRDIKSSNILVDSDMRPIILDFGLAAIEGGEKLTKVGSTIGTVAYMSPEQAQGGRIDHRSDLFSFGVVLYELITGHTPFKRDNDAATLKAIVNAATEPLARFRANVPDELQRIVSKLLERDPSLRYQTSAGVIADLKKLAISSSSGSVVPVEQEPNRTWLYVAAVAVIAVVVYFQFLRQSDEERSSALADMTVTRITDNGRIGSAAISPDGNYLAHTKNDDGMMSLWIKQVATGSSVEIVKPAEVDMGAVSFSHDGNFVYYIAQESSTVFNLFRIPVLGGTASQILTDLNGGRVSFSPDGARMTFARYFNETGEFAIMTANADGSDVKKLAARKVDEWYIGQPAWSPDGKLIACTKGLLKPNIHTEMVLLDAITGEETWLSSENWNSVYNACWLPDSKGLLFLAASMASVYSPQIWYLSETGARPQRITNDLNNYFSLSLTSNGEKIAACQNDSRAGVWIVPGGDTEKAKQLTRGKYDGSSGLAWADKKIIYGTLSDGKYVFQSIAADGSASTELISVDKPIYDLSVSPDGRFFVYVDRTEGIPNIWRADVDGKNKKRISVKDAECYAPKVSPDGKWVVFESWETGPLIIMKAPIDGGTHVPLTSESSSAPAISSDGRTVACLWRESQNAPAKIALIPFEGGDPVKLFDFPATADLGLWWSPDGTAIMYEDTRKDVSNIWSQPIDGSSPVQVTEFTDKHISLFAWSPDGKDLAVSRFSYENDVVLISNFR
jgi:serine/threonine protein kinase